MKTNKKNKEKEKFKFIFPNIMSKMMKEVPMRVQLESSLISMFLIMISLSFMVFYLLFFGEGSIAYKIILTINLVCGFMFISSFLVTTYQQYISHMEMMGYDPKKEKEEVRKRGNIFKRIGLAIKERNKIKKKEKENRENGKSEIKELIDQFRENEKESIKEQKKFKPYSKLLNKNFIGEALSNMEKIDKEKIEDFKRIQEESMKMQNEINLQEQKELPKNIKKETTKQNKDIPKENIEVEGGNNL